MQGNYYAVITTNYGIASSYGSPIGDEKGVTAFEKIPDKKKTTIPGFKITDISDKTYGDDPFFLSVEGNDNGLMDRTRVTYQVTDGNDIVTVVNNKVTIKRSGTATIRATYPEDENFLESTCSVEITIAKAPLTITADSKQILVGSPMPKLTYSTNGLKNNDTFSEPTLTTTAMDTDTIGTYDINISGGEPSNPSYTISYQKGTLKIVEGGGTPEHSNGNTDVGGDPGTDENSDRGAISVGDPSGGATGVGDPSGGASGTDEDPGGGESPGKSSRSRKRQNTTKSKTETTPAKPAEAAAPEEKKPSDEKKRVPSSFMPSERGIIIIDDLFFDFLVILLLLLLLFRRNSKKGSDKT